MRKGTRVYVEFDDITADLHSENDLEVAEGEVVGWILSDTKRALKLTTCRYQDGKLHKEKDRFTLPRGCVRSMEEI
jgi:hypothetical protein